MANRWWDNVNGECLLLPFFQLLCSCVRTPCKLCSLYSLSLFILFHFYYVCCTRVYGGQYQVNFVFVFFFLRFFILFFWRNVYGASIVFARGATSTDLYQCYSPLQITIAVRRNDKRNGGELVRNNYASLHHVYCVCVCVRDGAMGAATFRRRAQHITTSTSVAPSMRDVLVTIICLNYRWWITVHLQWKIRFLLVFYVRPFPLPINFDVVIFAFCRAHSRWLGRA